MENRGMSKLSFFAVVDHATHYCWIVLGILTCAIFVATSGIYLVELAMGMPFVFPPEWWTQ